VSPDNVRSGVSGRENTTQLFELRSKLGNLYI
jgi:hypothetical protein